MKKVIVFTLVLAFISCGKDSHLLEGKVSNANGEVIEDVLIQVMGTDLNSRSNADGFFRINTKNRGEELIFTHPDYEMHRMSIDGAKDVSVELIKKKVQKQKR